MKKYHYTYLLIGADHRLYIGKRSCNCLPEKDNYWGSYHDKTFKPTSKHIQEVFSTKEEALTHEIKLHNEFDVAKNPLFANRSKQTSIGWDTTGIKHTEESRAKMKIAQKDKKFSEAARLAQRNSVIGKPLSEEHKAKLARAGRNRIHSEETKLKMSQSNKGKNSGKICSEKTKLQISAKLKNRVFTDEHRAKLIENHWRRKTKEIC